MSKVQWGHGYWKGVEDAVCGNIRVPIGEEVKFWIANMCLSNCYKTSDRSLFPVKEWISYAAFCGLSEKYAKKIYNYILNNNYYHFSSDGKVCWCYVSGDLRWDWKEDYFIVPHDDYTAEEWQSIADKIREKIKGESNENR